MLFKKKKKWIHFIELTKYFGTCVKFRCLLLSSDDIYFFHDYINVLQFDVNALVYFFFFKPLKTL